jgi:hypothetical protein
MRPYSFEPYGLLIALVLAGCSSAKVALPIDPPDGDAPPAGKDTKSPSGPGGKKPVDTSKPPADDGDAPSAPEDEPDAIGVAKRPNLQWKRHHALEADLSRALELAPDELCTEFGKESCIQRVHLVPLGGHAPFESGMLESAAEPLATTPTVVDRVVLSACSKRAELDRELGKEAKVFSALALSEPMPKSDQGRANEVVTTLYRRLLARNPDEQERELVASLALGEDGEPLAALEFAKLACFTIGTSSEFLFF